MLTPLTTIFNLCATMSVTLLRISSVFPVTVYKEASSCCTGDISMEFRSGAVFTVLSILSLVAGIITIYLQSRREEAKATSASSPVVLVFYDCFYLVLRVKCKGSICV